MAKSLQKVLLIWAIVLLVFLLSAVTLSYFLGVHQAKQLHHVVQSQSKQLQIPVSPVPEQRASSTPEIPAVDVSSLLTQAAKQHNVDLHYQQNPDSSEQWLVGVNGSQQRAVGFVASVMQAQQQSLQAFPFTQTLRWQDTDVQSGKLSWQFLWLTANDISTTDINSGTHAGVNAEINASTLFKTNFPPVTATPPKCSGKPAIKSDIQINDWALVQLLATQTSPLRKALLKIPNQPLLTLTENSWIETPLIQLKKVEREFAIFQLWEKDAGCWSTQPVKLRLTKDNNPQ